MTIDPKLIERLKKVPLPVHLTAHECILIQSVMNTLAGMIEDEHGGELLHVLGADGQNIAPPELRKLGAKVVRDWQEILNESLQGAR